MEIFCSNAIQDYLFAGFCVVIITLKRFTNADLMNRIDRTSNERPYNYNIMEV